jgi:hypothetical protein
LGDLSDQVVHRERSGKQSLSSWYQSYKLITVQLLFVGLIDDMDQRDPKGVWPNLSRRSNEQQDNNKRIKFEIDQIKPS